MRIHLLAALFAISSVHAVHAQSVFNPSPPAAPAPYGSSRVVSPYLNLLRGGDPAANYYLGVLPEQQRRYEMSRPPITIDMMPRYDSTVDDRVNLDVLEKQLPPTGHPTGFMIYNSYYNLPNQRSFMPYNPQAGGRQVR